MGQCMKICEGTFCLKMVDSTAITGRIISILILDQFSQRSKMRLELAHLMQPRAKPSLQFNFIPMSLSNYTILARIVCLDKELWAAISGLGTWVHCLRTFRIYVY